VTRRGSSVANRSRSRFTIASSAASTSDEPFGPATNKDELVAADAERRDQVARAQPAVLAQRLERLRDAADHLVVRLPAVEALGLAVAARIEVHQAERAALLEQAPRVVEHGGERRQLDVGVVDVVLEAEPLRAQAEVVRPARRASVKRGSSMLLVGASENLLDLAQQLLSENGLQM
jgi:hypothetical protein